MEKVKNKNLSKVLSLLVAIMLICSALLFSACGNSSGDNQEPLILTAEQKINKLYDSYWNDKTSYGFQVKNGTIYLGKYEYYGIGVNSYSLFIDAVYNDFSAQTVSEAFKILSSYDIKVIRFDCGMYYGNELKYFLDSETKPKYLKLINNIFSLAEQYKIGLIPSFFWNIDSVPDYYNEDRTAWGDITSKTTHYLEYYTTTIANEIKDYKSLFAWEFGNEFMLNCDIPDSSKKFSCDDITVCYKLFTDTISKIDTHKRMIETGDANIRSSQYNQWKNGIWKADTIEERYEVYDTTHPSKMTAISEHVYDIGHDDKAQFDDPLNYLKTMKSLSKALNKAYIVGEWGSYNENAKCFDNYNTFAGYLMTARVQLSFVWNYDYIWNSEKQKPRTEYSFCHYNEFGRNVLSFIQSANINYADLLKIK